MGAGRRVRWGGEREIWGGEVRGDGRGGGGGGGPDAKLSSTSGPHVCLMARICSGVKSERMK